MEKRGFAVTVSESVAEGVAAARSAPPAFAVVDLRLQDGTGLDIVSAIQDSRADSKVIVLTGYGAIASAVAAVKMGAIDYLSKPSDADDITAALLATDVDRPPPPEKPMSAGILRSRSSGVRPSPREMASALAGNGKRSR